MTHWQIALAAYLTLALVSVGPAIFAILAKIPLHPGGPAFEDAPHFSQEAKIRLRQNYDRMLGTLGFWKKQAVKYERMHIYRMSWIIVLSFATPALTQIIPQYKDDPYASLFLNIATLHIALITSIHKFLKVEVNFKRFARESPSSTIPIGVCWILQSPSAPLRMSN
jgi:hypothetical protein